MAESVRDCQYEIYYRIARAAENFIKKGKNNLTKSAAEARIAQLKKNWEKFEANHEVLTQAKSEVKRELDYFKEKLYDKCEEAYLDAAGTLDEYIPAIVPASDTSQNRPETEVSRVAVTLPRISLLQFSGKYQDWIPFRDLFNSMVDENEQLSDVQKLHYLKVNVTGEAAKLIANIPVTAENYQRTWDRLESRYENKRALVNAQLDILFNLKHLSRKSSKDLETLRTTTKEVLEALQALDAPVQHWDYLLVYFICRRLDAETHEDWEVHLGSSTVPPTYENLDQFLEARIRALETIQARGSSRNSNTHRVASSHVATSSSKIVCSCCGNNDHYISKCAVYMLKSLSDRKELVTKNKLCYNCLGPHQLKTCTSTKRCRTCNGKHHTSIHTPKQETSQEAIKNATVQTTSQAGDGTGSYSRSTHHSMTVSSPSKDEQVLLPTAIVPALSASNQVVMIRALLDQGSETSLIKESAVQALKLHRSHSNLALKGVGGQHHLNSRGSTVIRPRGKSIRSNIEIHAHILPRVTGLIPSTAIFREDWPHLSNLTLADPHFDLPADVDLLIGADLYGQLLTGKVRKGESTQPVAQETIFGWIVSGPVTSSTTSSYLEAQGYTCVVDNHLSTMVQEFWAQEAVPSSAKTKISTSDAECEEHFKSTVTRVNGRFMVRLPFKTKPNHFGDIQGIATKMLNNLHRRFCQNPKLKRMYIEFLDEYLKLGHMTELNSKLKADSYFLPHHGVLRESSVTTKLRVVFNGSQKSNLNTSLNECLHSGPKVQSELIDVILRWRSYQIGFAADIEKMYRQILVHPDDQQYQLILWKREGSETPTIYQLATVTYGLSCAPYLALRSLLQLALEEGDTFPLGAEVVKSNMYVDDVLSGGDSKKECTQKVRQLDEMLKSAGFILQKWASNVPEVLNCIEESRISPPCHARSIHEEAELRALGLRWNPSSDNFILGVQNEIPQPICITRRSVLSVVASLFDPIGWLSPVITVGKIFLQKLWKTKLGWDDQIPPSLESEWTSFVNDLNNKVTITIPRWIGVRKNAPLEFHGFADASTKALAAVVYLKILHPDLSGSTSLIMAKTKVAPVKPMTVARLELSAAVLLVKLTSQVLNSLNFRSTIPINLWTDSTVTLTWIKGEPAQWKEFVGNRVAFIQDSLPKARWRHIAGTDNPADVASRGIAIQLLQNHHLWWNGPKWLGQPPREWPTSCSDLPSDVDLESRAKVSHLTAKVEDTWLIERYSSLDKLVRVTARLLRIKNGCKGSEPEANFSMDLQPIELENALRFWVLRTQRTYFEDEISKLSKREAISKSSKLIRLTPFLDQNNVLRLGGRLKNFHASYEVKHPAIIPSTSLLADLIINDAHLRTAHGGTQLTLCTIRQKFWILDGRNPVRKRILKCVRCVRQRGALAHQMMGQLPPSRITPSRPFLHTGVDYAGPYTIKTWRGRGAKTQMGYFVLFICLVTSAVHLEMVTDYSSSGFMSAYKRFISRRGICASFTSDCGTNFVGADKELRNLFNQASTEFSQIRNLLATDRTTWNLNPPSAPHFGGKWEAGVKSTKHHIKRVVGDALLTYEEWTLLLAQIECLLNSRPLSPMSDDPDDFSILTPGHFLIGAPLNAIPEPSLTGTKLSGLSHWQQLQVMVEHFWDKWSTEHIHHLQSVYKWQYPQHSIKHGALVLVSDSRLPPTKWPLARVIETHPGADDLVRVVTLRTASNSVMKRPIHKLCILPVESN